MYYSPRTTLNVGLIIKNGQDDPHWRDKVEKKQDCTHQYYRKSWKIIEGSCYAESWIKGAKPPSGVIKVGWAPHLLPDFLANNIIETRVKDNALRKIKKKIDSDEGQFNALVSLGELKDLRGTIGGSLNLLSSFLKGLNALKKKNWKSFLVDKKRTRGSHSNPFDWASDAWLGFSFAINPTIADINNLLDSIQAFKDRKDFTKHYKGAAVEHYETSKLVPQTAYVYGLSHTRHIVANHSIGYKYTSAINFDWETANNYGIAGHLGFCPEAVIPALWELLPWSWALDYISTAGAFWNDTFQTQVGDTIYLCENRSYKCTWYDSIVKPSWTPLVTNCKLFATPQSGEYFEFTRTPLQKLPHRAYRFKSIDEIVGDPYLVKKMLNLLAIVQRRS